MNFPSILYLTSLITALIPTFWWFFVFNRPLHPALLRLVIFCLIPLINTTLAITFPLILAFRKPSPYIQYRNNRLGTLFSNNPILFETFALIYSIIINIVFIYLYSNF